MDRDFVDAALRAARRAALRRRGRDRDGRPAGAHGDRRIAGDPRRGAATPRSSGAVIFRPSVPRCGAERALRRLRGPRPGRRHHSRVCSSTVDRARADLGDDRRTVLEACEARSFTTPIGRSRGALRRAGCPTSWLGDPAPYLGAPTSGGARCGYQAALGCRFRCTFCGVAAMFRGATALPPAERLEQDLLFLRDRSAWTPMQFYDHNFFDREDDMVPLLEVLARLRLPWWCFARSDALVNLSDRAWSLVRQKPVAHGVHRCGVAQRQPAARHAQGHAIATRRSRSSKSAGATA